MSVRGSTRTRTPVLKSVTPLSDVGTRSRHRLGLVGQSLCQTPQTPLGNKDERDRLLLCLVRTLRTESFTPLDVVRPLGVRETPGWPNTRKVSTRTDISPFESTSGRVGTDEVSYRTSHWWPTIRTHHTPPTLDVSKDSSRVFTNWTSLYWGTPRTKRNPLVSISDPHRKPLHLTHNLYLRSVRCVSVILPVSETLPHRPVYDPIVSTTSPTPGRNLQPGTNLELLSPSLIPNVSKTMIPFSVCTVSCFWSYLRVCAVNLSRQ